MKEWIRDHLWEMLSFITLGILGLLRKIYLEWRFIKDTIADHSKYISALKEDQVKLSQLDLDQSRNIDLIRESVSLLSGQLALVSDSTKHIPEISQQLGEIKGTLSVLILSSKNG